MLQLIRKRYRREVRKEDAKSNGKKFKRKKENEKKKLKRSEGKQIKKKARKRKAYRNKSEWMETRKESKTQNSPLYIFFFFFLMSTFCFLSLIDPVFNAVLIRHGISG